MSSLAQQKLENGQVSIGTGVFSLFSSLICSIYYLFLHMTKQQMLTRGHCTTRGSSLAVVQWDGAGGGSFCFMYVLRFVFTFYVLGVKKWEIWTLLAKHIHTNTGFCFTCSAVIILIYSVIFSKWIKQASPFSRQQDHIHDTFFYGSEGLNYWSSSITAKARLIHRSAEINLWAYFADSVEVVIFFHLLPRRQWPRHVTLILTHPSVVDGVQYHTVMISVVWASCSANNLDAPACSSLHSSSPFAVSAVVFGSAPVFTSENPTWF